MIILVTGGTGYIGSHTCIALLNEGHDVIIVDNLSNSSSNVVNKIALITGKKPGFVKGDLRDEAILESVFKAYSIDAVIHFAGLKAVGESVSDPLTYYDNNVSGSITLFKIMKKYHVNKLVFSSSATVYGTPQALPIQEDFPLHPTNPYGQTKLMIEQMLGDIAAADKNWRISILRYFNPVGAHNCGLIGEAPSGIPNNLMPYIAQVAAGQREFLSIFGDDYPSPDGTGVRDYIHVVDLAAGHLKALEKLMRDSGLCIYNLGTGNGFSVLEMVDTFEKASGKPVPYRIMPRRSGDVAQSYADPQKAQRELGWKATRSIQEMCADSWRWHSRSIAQI